MVSTKLSRQVETVGAMNNPSLKISLFFCHLSSEGMHCRPPRQPVLCSKTARFDIATGGRTRMMMIGGRIPHR